MPSRRCAHGHGIHTGPRCPTCKAQYNYAWQARSRNERAAHPYCTQCGSTQDLVLDHIQTADPSRTQVLCRACNSHKA